MPENIYRSRPLKQPATTEWVEPFLVTRDQLAVAVVTSARTIDNWREQGIIPFIKVGGVVRFDVAKVKHALESRFEVQEVHVRKKRVRKQAAAPAA